MTKTFSRGCEAFELERDQLDAAQAAFFNRISTGPRGRVPINLRAWLHNLPFAEVVEPFGLYVSNLAPSISPREREITVLVNARFWQARFEWVMHQRHGLKVGLTPAQIEAIRTRQDPGFDNVGEDLTYRLADSLHEDKAVGDALYQRAMVHFGHAGVSDRIGLIGLYSMIAMTLNFYAVPEPSGSA